MSGGPMNGLLAGESGWVPNDEATGYPRADADLAYNEDDVFDNRHAHGQRPGDLSPQRSSQIDPSAYQTELARADPRRFSYLTVSQDAFSMLEHSFDPNSLESFHHGTSDFDQSFSQAMPETTMLGGRGPIEARYNQQYMPHVAIAHQAMQAIMSEGSLPLAQHHGHGQSGRSMPDPSFPSPGTAMHQSQPVHHAMERHQLAAMNMYAIPDRGSHGANTGAAPLDPDLSSVQSQDAATSTVKSLVCPICKRQSKNRPALRHHLDIHNPEKTSKYKCKHCNYASRYPKDVRRHNLTHEKPNTPQFVCNEPDCDGKFDRKDNLQRHIRSAHQNASSARSSGTKTHSHLDNSDSSSANAHLPVYASVDGPRETLLESFDSLNDSGFVVNHTSSLSAPQTVGSSFNGYLDPFLMSPTSVSDSFYFSGAESPCPK